RSAAEAETALAPIIGGDGVLGYGVVHAPEPAPTFHSAVARAAVRHPCARSLGLRGGDRRDRAAGGRAPPGDRADLAPHGARGRRPAERLVREPDRADPRALRARRGRIARRE